MTSGSGRAPPGVGLLGPDEFRRIAEGALSISGADGVEVLLMHEWGGLTRFASSEIHQSTSREDTGLRVRVANGGRVGVAATNEATAELLLATKLPVPTWMPCWPLLVTVQPEIVQRHRP